MTTSRWIGILLLCAVAPVLWFQGRFLMDLCDRLPEDIDRTGSMSLAEREERTLTWNGSVPHLLRTAALVRPVVEDGEVLQTTFSFVAPGLHDRAPALRGATILSYLLAPRAWVLGPPLEMLEALFGAEGPPGPQLAELASSQFIVWAGVSAQQVEKMRASAAAKYEREVLVRGWSDGDRLHVTLRFDVAAKARAGDPDHLRFRPLLAP